MINTEIILVLSKWIAIVALFSFSVVFTVEGVVRFTSWVGSYANSMWRE